MILKCKSELILKCKSESVLKYKSEWGLQCKSELLVLNYKTVVVYEWVNSGMASEVAFTSEWVSEANERNE